MRRTLIACSLVLTGLLAACAGPQLPPQQRVAVQGQAQSGHQMVTLHWRTPAELQDLVSSGLDLFAPDHVRKELTGRLSTAEIVRLQQQGIRVQVQTARARAAEERQAFPTGYMTYAQLKARLQALAAARPDLVRLEDVGDTWDKQQGKADHDIWAVQLNPGQRQGKPTVLMTGGVHARELAPVELLSKLIDQLVAGYGQDERITRLLNSRNLVILPMVNVDGRVKVEQGSAWQRKNTHGTGIDLNRNFDNHWNYAGLSVPDSWKRGISDPNSEIYSGSAPASEPETQVVQAIMHRYKPIVFVDMHAYGELMLWPLGYQSADIAQVGIYRDLWQKSLKPLDFKGGNSPQLLYPTTATTRDYAYQQHRAMSMTIEVGKDFRPSYAEVEKMWSQLRGPLLSILEAPGLGN